MDNRLDLRQTRLKTLNIPPALSSKWDTANNLGNEEDCWELIFAMEKYLVQDWPDLRHLYTALESREPSEIRDEVLFEAHRRCEAMVGIRTKIEREIGPGGLSQRGNAYLALALLSYKSKS